MTRRCVNCSSLEAKVFYDQNWHMPVKVATILLQVYHSQTDRRVFGLRRSLCHLLKYFYHESLHTNETICQMYNLFVPVIMIILFSMHVPDCNCCYLCMNCYPISSISPWILDWTCYLWTPLCHVYIPYKDILQGSSRLCNWLSLRRLVSWINPLPPVCWSIFFGNLV